MRILIGYDGSDCAVSAIEDLPKAGLPPEAEARVVSVDEIWGLAGLEDATEIAESRAGAMVEIREQAEQACQRLRMLFPAWTVAPELFTGSPARILIDRADAWQADLIVVGAQSPGYSLMKGTAHQVVTEAHCSVRVARRDNPHARPPRIIIGVDGSPQSKAAVSEVAARNWPSGAEIRLITSLLRAPVLIESHPWREWYQARDIHLDARRELEAGGLKVSSSIEEGDPKRVLIDRAIEWEADSIFIGATSLHRIARFLLGSIPSALILHAGCSIEVIRTGKSEGATAGTD